MKLDTVIGLEFHIQLKTKTKMFCACANNENLSKPNFNICPICLAHPGTLPMVNEQAINMAIKAALALNCQINLFTKFDRKNYFYPDLPKGYQISQYDKPLAQNGYLDINYVAEDGLAAALDIEEQIKRIRIARLHMEEDSAKSIHQAEDSLIDYNRAGAPLIEIVTQADFSSPKEAKFFAQDLQLLIQKIDISDASMEKGQLRCDANISLKPHGATHLFPKTEIKNINSFRSLEKALEYEQQRQKKLWLDNKAPTVEETRGWDDKKMITVLQRKKEGQADYRYFPEPDLPPLTFEKQEIDQIKSALPELPQQKRQRFYDEYGFTYEQIKIITADDSLANYCEKVVSELREWLNCLPKTQTNAWPENKSRLIQLCANWLINRFLKIANDQKLAINKVKITPENFAEFLTYIHQKKLSSTNAQKVLEIMFQTGADPSHVIEEQNLEQTDDHDSLIKIIDQVITAFPDQVTQYQNGKEPIIKFLLGQVIKESKGKANPQELEKMLKEKLKK